MDARQAAETGSVDVLLKDYPVLTSVAVGRPVRTPRPLRTMMQMMRCLMMEIVRARMRSVTDVWTDTDI